MKGLSKYLFLVTLAAMFFLSCEVGGGDEEATGTIVVYKVDYNTLAFEGGISFPVALIQPPLPTLLPLEIQRDEPNVDTNGGIYIGFGPTLDPIFTAELNLDGDQEIFFPEFSDPANFFELDEQLPFPSGSNLQSIEGSYTQAEFQAVWDVINGFGLTEVVVSDNTKYALFLYQPNAAAQYSDNWDWILILHNQ